MKSQTITLAMVMFCAGPSPARAADGVVLYNLHTRESLTVPDGVIPSPNRINRFFRCRSRRRYTLMDPRPLVAAIDAARQFGAGRVMVVSAFRTRAFNEQLRHTGHKVALHSRHVHGQALDFRIPGVRASVLCAYFLEHWTGGVGCYRRQRFVHIDVGPLRSWNG